MGGGTIIHLSLWDSNVRSLLLFLSSVSGRSPPRAAGLRKVQVRPALLMSQPFILFLLATNPNLFSLSLSCKKTSWGSSFFVLRSSEEEEDVTAAAKTRLGPPRSDQPNPFQSALWWQKGSWLRRGRRNNIMSFEEIQVRYFEDWNFKCTLAVSCSF